jgi:hypothetical protein
MLLKLVDDPFRGYILISDSEDLVNSNLKVIEAMKDLFSFIVLVNAS